MEDLGETSPRRPKATLESKARVGALVSVKVPKDLYSAAIAAGHQSATARTHQLQHDGAGSPGKTGVAPRASMRTGPLTLEKAGVQRRVPVPRQPVPTKQWTEEYHFGTDAGDTYPPRPVEYPVDEADMVDADNPFGWVPSDEQVVAGGGSMRPSSGHMQTQGATVLALELFDSPDMELIAPRDKLSGDWGDKPGPPASSRFYDTNGGFSWAPCYVTEYEPESDRYCIQWQAGNPSAGKTKWVKRLNLLFDDERTGFRSRLREARRRKAQVEREARYAAYIAAQPFRNPEGLGVAGVARVMARAGRATALAGGLPGVTADYINEARGDYRLAVNAAIVDFLFGDPDGSARLAALDVQPVKLRASCAPSLGVVDLSALPLGVMTECEAGPNGGPHTSTPMPLEAFHLLLADVSGGAVAGSPQLLSALQAYLRDLDVTSLQICDTRLAGLPLPAKLPDFVRMQRMHRDEVADQLTQEWTMRVLAVLENLLPALGDISPRAPGDGTPRASGDVTPRVTADEAGAPGPAMSRVQVVRFVKMLSLVMGDQLRTAVLSSIREYVEFWRRYDFADWHEAARAGLSDAQSGLPTAPVGSTAEPASANAEWRGSHGAPKWGADLFSTVPPPLLQVQIAVRDGAICMVPELELVEEAVMESFDDLLTAVQAVDDISVKLTDATAERCLSPISPEEPAVAHARAEVTALLTKSLRGPAELLASFQEFAHLVEVSPDAYVAEWAAGEPSLEQSEAELARLSGVASAVSDKSEAHVTFRMLRVDCSRAQAELADSAIARRSALLEWLAKNWASANLTQLDHFDELVHRLNEEPDTTEGMDELEKFVVGLEMEMETLEGKIGYSRTVYDVLSDARHSLDNDSSEMFWELCQWPVTLGIEIEEVRGRVARYRSRYLTQLKHDQATLVSDLASLKAEVDAFVWLGDLKLVDDRLSTVLDIEARTQALAVQADLYQARERIFGLAQTEYPQIQALQKAYEQAAMMWRTCSELMRCLPEWMDGPFPEIDAEVVASDCDKWWRGTAKLAKTLEGPTLEVVTAVRARLEEFQAHIPLITAMRNPGLRDHHWTKISAAVGMSIKADAGFSLSRALQLGLPAHMAAIEEVSEFASKE
ncbi:hypothetical protein FOA52_012567 [Chlamydomonas sp. UWO 241]|nr:hypothetical protein FOA52_012567 [Chlamydomonas sp. UWO 241]